MSNDAVLLQGRQIKRKLKNILLLMSAAAFAIFAAWAVEHQETIYDACNGFFARYDRQSYGDWINTGLYDDAVFLEDAVIYAGSDGICVMTLDGTTKYRCETKLVSPQCVYAKRAAAVYEPGGTELILLNEDGVNRIVVSEGIDAAAVSDDGALAVITVGSGFQTETKRYDAQGNIMFDCGLTDAAMGMMTFLRGTDTLASCVVSTMGTWTLRYDTAEHTTEIPLEDALVYEIKPCGDGVALWTSAGIKIYSAEGRLTGKTDISAEQMAAWDSDGFAAVLVRSGGQYQMTTLTASGTITESTPLPRTPRGVSVCGNTVCILDTEALLVYDKSCALRDQTSYGAEAKTAQAIHGGAILFGNGEFMRYLTA